MRIARMLPFLAVITAAGAGAGLLYAILASSHSLRAGMIYGAAIGFTVSLFERGLLLGGVQDRMRRWPSLIYIPVSEVACVILVCLGFAIGGVICWALELIPDPFVQAVVPAPRVVAYGFLVSGILIFVTRVRDLLGRAVFTNFLIGRYHRPVAEERIFLFLDLAGSTAYARLHGDLKAQEYLSAIFAALAEPVGSYGGSIDDYVGDMAMITWPLLRGARNGDCVRCLFAILDGFERDRARWQNRFGTVPRFHAALHGGPVVTAEVGIDRHKISYFGDVVNTTGRLERLCRELGAPVLVSGSLLGRLAVLPSDVRPRSFGDHALKGIGGTVEAFALERTSDPDRHLVRGGRRSGGLQVATEGVR